MTLSCLFSLFSLKKGDFEKKGKLDLEEMGIFACKILEEDLFWLIFKHCVMLHYNFKVGAKIQIKHFCNVFQVHPDVEKQLYSTVSSANTN